MIVLIHNSGEGFTPLADALEPKFGAVSSRLSGRDYGGPMQALWIGVELYEYGMNIPDRPPYPFRFQKRVSPRAFGLQPTTVHHDVGHYSLRPSVDDMRADDLAVAVRQVLAVVARSADCLRDRRQLRGFDFANFQKDFVEISATV